MKFVHVSLTPICSMGMVKTVKWVFIKYMFKLPWVINLRLSSVEIPRNYCSNIHTYLCYVAGKCWPLDSPSRNTSPSPLELQEHVKSSLTCIPAKWTASLVCLRSMWQNKWLDVISLVCWRRLFNWYLFNIWQNFFDKFYKNRVTIATLRSLVNETELQAWLWHQARQTSALMLALVTGTSHTCIQIVMFLFLTEEYFSYRLWLAIQNRHLRKSRCSQLPHVLATYSHTAFRLQAGCGFAVPSMHNLPQIRVMIFTYPQTLSHL